MVVDLDGDSRLSAANLPGPEEEDKLLLSVFSAKQPAVELDWRSIVDPALLTDENFRQAFDGAHAREFIKVYRPDLNSYYYLIPFDKYAKGEFLTYAALIIDAQTGSFLSASWLTEPGCFVPVGEQEAIELVLGAEVAAGVNPQVSVSLVWRAQGLSSSPFYPYWQVKVGDVVRYVTQKREVF